MWFVGLDVHSETTSVSIRSSRGIVVLRTVVPTNSAALRKVLSQARGRVKVACEAGPLASWISRSLTTQFREVIVCDRRRTCLGVHGESKSDRCDADRLSELLRTGAFNPVFVPQGAQLELRRYVLHYVRMIRERRRAKQRLNALFLESAVRLPPKRNLSKGIPLRQLPPGAARDMARAYLQQYRLADELVESARKLLLESASANPVFQVLQSIPYIGQIRAAMLLGIVITMDRFSARRKFWSYGGLGVIQRVSAEHRLENGRPVRDSRTRGIRLSKRGQPLLKKVLADIALQASVGRGALRAIYERHVARGKRPAIARLALARKVASVIAAVWRTGKPYEELLIIKRKKFRGEHQSRRSAASAPALARLRC